MEGLSHFESLANRYGFVVVYPGSTLTNGDVWRSPSDIPYISSLIRQIESNRRYDIDPGRVYVTGFSAGGRFAYQVACALSRQITAIAAVSGLERASPCRLAHPVSELSIFGGAESVVNGNASAGIPSQAMIEAWWRGRDGCTGAIRAASAYPLTEHSSGPCADGTRVESIIVRGGVHTWPGCPCSLPPSSPDARWNASQGIWAFFRTLRSSG
jgi:polyhydroxybutyrate depolymerase